MSATQSDQQPLLHERQQPFDGAIGANKILATAAQSGALPSHQAAQFDQPLIDLATLQVSGGAAADKDAKSDTKEESHEHPCVCDLRLPRKPLTNEERHARFKDWHLTGSTGGRGAKSPSSSSERKRVAGQRPAKRVASPMASKSAGKTRTSPKKRRPGTDQHEEEGRVAGVGFGKRTMTRSRSRGPRIAVKLNRAATLRMEKGNTYCGKRPLPLDRFQMGRVQGAEEVKKKQRKARPADANCPYRVCKRIR